MATVTAKGGRVRHNGGLAVVLLAAAVSLAACQEETGAGDAGDGPALQAPSQSPDVSARRYTPGAEAAAITGWLDLNESYQLGAAGQDAEAAALGQTILKIKAERGQSLAATLQDTLDPSAQVGGQTVRNLMSLPLDAAPLLYAVSAQAGAPGLCGEMAVSHLAMWEDGGGPQGPMALLATAGGAPGQAGATLCQALSYERQG